MKSRLKYLYVFIFVVSFLMVIGTFSSTNAESLNVDNHSKADIANYIKNNGVNLNDAVDYATEPVFNTTPGNMTEATKQRALKMLNNIRYVAGVPEVALDKTYGEKSQTIAFVLAAVGEGVSHYPKGTYTKPDGMPDSVWDTAHIGGMNSMLVADTKKTLNQVILGWMDDSGKFNVDTVENRRYIINPKMGKTGFGAASRTEAKYRNYYAEYSFDNSGAGNQTNVAWPARYMPIEYFGDDIAWSLSTGLEINNTSNVSVTLSRRASSPSGAGSWSFNNPGSFATASSGKYFNVDNNYFGQPGCIIFRPDNIKYKRGDIFDVTINGAGAETISYTVEFIQVYPIQSIDLGEDICYISRFGWNKNLPIETVPADAGKNDLIWETSDSSIATVSDGKITPVKPGRVIITCKAPASYTETGSEIVATKTVVITKDIDDPTLDIQVKSPEFTGEIVRPKVTIVDTEKNYTLVEGKDYSLDCPDDLVYPSDGQGIVNIDGLNEYGGPIGIGRYYSVQKKIITKDMIELSAEEFEYNGKVQMPVVNVKNGTLPMTPGRDYTVNRTESKDVGEYTVKVRGIGDNYWGSVSLKYTIVKKRTEDQIINDATSNNWKSVQPTKGSGNSSGSSNSSTSIDNILKNEKATTKAKVSALKKLKKKYIITYKGKLKFKIKSEGKLTFKSNKRKIVKVNKKGVVTGKRYGTAKITIKEKIKGKKAKKKKVTIKVIPKTPVIKSLKTGKSKQGKPCWVLRIKKLDKSVTGYQVVSSKIKSFKKGQHEEMKLPKKKFKKNVTKLGIRSGKVHYIKIRAYKKVGKKYYISAWSNIKIAK